MNGIDYEVRFAGNMWRVFASGFDIKAFAAEREARDYLAKVMAVSKTSMSDKPSRKAGHALGGDRAGA